jgi:uncharacterized protein (TIGR02246 family)
VLQKFAAQPADTFGIYSGLNHLAVEWTLPVDADNQKKPTGPTPGYQKTAPPEINSDEPLPNSAADEFFVKMNRDFRRPKPSEEAVAAALHAIQTLAGDAAEHNVEATAVANASADDFPAESPGARCPKCRAVNSGSNRFCGFCGTLLARHEKPAGKAASPASSLVRGTQPEQTPPEQHIHHHHYHYFSESMAKHSFGDANATLTGELAASQSTDPAAAETAIQKLVSDWTLCCNSKRLEDLLALYSPDAIVLRANVAPAHGRSAIRQLLQTALQAGLGDVELDCADAGVLGDIACLTGRSRMLVPTAPGKRHEEIGKFLIVARRESGTWKILADSWCIDAVPKQPVPPTAPAPPTPRVK